MGYPGIRLLVNWGDYRAREGSPDRGAGLPNVVYGPGVQSIIIKVSSLMVVHTRLAQQKPQAREQSITNILFITIDCALLTN